MKNIFPAPAFIKQIKASDELLNKYKTRSQRYRLALKSANIGVWEYGIMNDDFYWGEEMTTIFDTEFNSASDLRQNWKSIVHEGDHSELKNFFRNALGGNEELNAAFRIINAKREVKYISVFATVVFDTKLQPFKIIGFCRDVTERKLAEIKLQQSETKYRILADNTLDVIALHKPDGIYEYISPSVYEVLGYRPEELIGKHPNDTMHPDDTEKVKITDANLSVVDQGNFVIQLRKKKKSGEWIYYETSIKTIRNDQGQLINLLTTSRDITKRVLNNIALEESMAKYKLLAENMLDMIAIVNADGCFDYISPSVKVLLGYSEEELVGKSCFDIIYYKDAQAFTKIIEENTRQKREGFLYDCKVCKKSGESIYFETLIKIIYTADGDIYKILTSSRDVTEFVTAKEALTESEEKYRSLIESSDAIIAMIDFNGRFLFVNKVCETFIGLSKKEMLGKSIMDIHGAEKMEYYLQNIQEVISEEKSTVVENALMYKGREFWLRSSIQPVRDSEGKVYAAFVNTIDLTNQKKSEQLFANQNKELKEIAFLQSHIVRAPLANIEGLLSLINESELSSENREYVRLLKESANKLDRIIKEVVERAVDITSEKNIYLATAKLQAISA